MMQKPLCISPAVSTLYLYFMAGTKLEYQKEKKQKQSYKFIAAFLHPLLILAKLYLRYLYKVQEIHDL